MEEKGERQIILENLRVFLEKRKQCSNVEDEVPVALSSKAPIGGGWPTSLSEDKIEAHIDFVGGRIYEDENKYPVVDLHCIEYKSLNDDIKKGIGQLFWYKFLIHESYTWVNHLFMYLMVDEEKTDDGVLKSFLRDFGFGFLGLSQESKIISEILLAEDQSEVVRRTALKDVQIHCSKDYNHKVKWEDLKKFQCPYCGAPLNVRSWIPEFADATLTSSRNRAFEGAPDYCPQAINQNPLLAKVFRNWDLVKKNWESG